MRIVVGGLAVLLALVVGEGAASACKHRGKILFRRTQSALEGANGRVPWAELQIYATGAWSWVQEMPDGAEPASQGGCLSKKHRAELERAVARAKFEHGEPVACDAAAEMAIEIESPKRKKKLRVSLPCGDTMDASTAALAACAELLVEPGKKSSKQVREACRGTAR